MPVSSTSGSEASDPAPAFEPSRRVVAIGLGALVAILLIAGIVLIVALPDAGAFDARVEQLFIENADLTSQAEIKLLEILAQSGTAFADTLASYRLVIFVLLLSSTALLVTSLAFLVILLAQSSRLRQMERQGIRVKSLALERETRTVQINDMEFQLTAAAMETLSVLAEARIDGDLLSGAEIEGDDHRARSVRLRRGLRGDADQAPARRAGRADGGGASGAHGGQEGLFARRRAGGDQPALNA